MLSEKLILKSWEKSIVEFPFEIFQDLENLEVRYSYDKKKGVIDIGIRGEEGIIGWSGGARSYFSLSEHNSTPGYKNHALSPQKLTLLLGVYRVVCEEGIPVQIEIIQKKKERKWVRGITHLHSVHSDGKLELHELLEMGKKYGMDYLIFSDHNTVSQNLELQGLRSEMLLIPGMEFSSYEGHANFVGVPEPVQDFRWKVQDFSWDTLSEEATKKGAYIGINHPFYPNCGWHYDLKNYDWIEIWNSIWDHSDELCRLWWTEKLRAGERIAIVGGSDFHKIKDDCNRFLTPVNHVLTSGYTQEDLLQSMKRGHSILVDENFPLKVLFRGEESEVGEETANEKIIVGVDGLPENNKVILVTEDEELLLSENRVSFHGEIDVTRGKFAYLLVKHGESTLAITNPLYFKRCQN